ncbi:MAG: lipase secretion chaperone [Lysobacter sp.]
MVCAALLAVAAIFAVGSWFETPGRGWAQWVSNGPASRVYDPGADPADVRAALANPVATARTDSLRDTEVDGMVRVDAMGRPVADREARRLFDYFLSRSGEQTPEAIRSDLLAHLQSRLAPQALATALAWFDAYLLLEHDSVAIAQAGEDRDEVFARLRALRRERLGQALADSWYAPEEREYERAQARRALWADRSIDSITRERRLAELDADLDPEQRLLQRERAQLDAALQQSQAFERRGVTPAVRFAEREASFGTQAAQRLAELDESKARWSERLRSYAAQRQRVLADAGLNDVQRQQRLSGLMQGFDPNERRRLDALTRNGKLPGQ